MKELQKELSSLREQLNALKMEEKLHEKNEKLFQALVETAVGEIGEGFFNKIIVKLSEWLNAECVIIGLLVDVNRVEGFPMYLDGEIVHGFSYTLDNTPCDLTSKKGYCVYEDNLKQLFPKSKDVQDLQALGYVGTALYNEKGDPNGILCAMSRETLKLPPLAESIMKIVGARITAEFERIKAQKELERSEKELRLSNTAKDKLFSIVAHDLKSPFNTLIGLSDLLSDDTRDNSPELMREYAHHINDVSKQTYTLLENMLEWSMSMTGGMKYKPETIDLTKLIDQTSNYFRQVASVSQINITAEGPGQLHVEADKNMLNTILRNLVSNAIKYTPAQGSICIRTSSSETETRIDVTDSGIGIPKETIEKLFAIDETVSTRGLNQEKGTGLGLMLCKDFVEKHKGRIWVESEVGKGSTFSFTIPG